MYEKPQVACVVEHGLKDYEVSAFERLFKYKIISVSSRSQFKGGGTMIMVSNSLISKNVKFPLHLCVDKDFEVSACSIRTELYEIIIVLVYKSPSGNFEVFLNNLSAFLDNYYLKHKIILVGDFNVDLKIDSNQANEMTNLLSSMNLRPTIFEDTRVTDHSATRIDNLFTNLPSSDLISSVMYTALSDHHGIFCSLKGEAQSSRPESPIYKYARKYDPVNLATMKAGCSDMIVDLQRVTPFDFINFIVGAHETFFPKIKTRFNQGLSSINKTVQREHYATVRDLSSELKLIRDSPNFNRELYLAIK